MPGKAAHGQALRLVAYGSNVLRKNGMVGLEPSCAGVRHIIGNYLHLSKQTILSGQSRIDRIRHQGIS